jgi:hypothetical protein
MTTASLTFRSKVDRWFTVVTIASSIICIGAFVATAIMGSLLSALVLSPVLLVAVILPVWVWRSTYYLLGERDLHIRSGPFRWTIPLDEIHGVAPTRSPLSSPALSLDRLRIDYGQGKSIMISPADQSTFITRLEEKSKAQR